MGFLKTLANDTKVCYNYDVLRRLTSKTVKDADTNQVISTESYSYDAAGNMTVAPSNSFTYGTNNRLSTFNGNSVFYDLDGNMTNDGQKSYTYDSSNRLISHDGHTYTYTPQNIRVKDLCGSATTYVYNTNAKLSQLLTRTKNGTTTKYVYGRGLIGEETSNVFKIYHFDNRGSTVAVTNSTGTIIDTFAYDAYGNVTSRTGTDDIIFQYNGKFGVITDSNGLCYMRARYYSPTMHRFINADIVPGTISNAVTLNRFAFANANPISKIDPLGLAPYDNQIKQVTTSAAPSDGVPYRIEPTALEAAYLAQHVYSAKNYGGNDSPQTIVGDWVFDKVIIDDNGFKIAVYYKTVYGQTGYALVNKGTSTMDDWKDNFIQPFGQSNDMKRSIKISSEFVNSHLSSWVTMVGYSKGGAEAVANAVATNSRAIVFNPATPALGLYLPDAQYNKNQIDTYVVEGELLSSLEFGRLYEKYVDDHISVKSNLDPENYYDESLISEGFIIGKITETYAQWKAKLECSYEKHLIETVIDAWTSPK